MSAGLEGRLIVVTRPRRQAGPLIQDLERAGARVIAAPLVRIAPPRSFKKLDAAIKNINNFDIILFSSANAVAGFFARAGRGLPRPQQLFAIGSQTAQALRDQGWKGAVTPPVFRAEGFSRVLGPLRGRRVLIPRAEKARDWLPAFLKKGGARVSIAPVYRTVADAAGIKRLKTAAGRKIDAVTFTSASSAAHFVRALGHARSRRLFRSAAAASIGPVTSSALRELGIRPAIEPKKATAAALARSLARHFRRNGGRP